MSERSSDAGGLSRRVFLEHAGLLGLGLGLAPSADLSAHMRRQPGTLPFPKLPEGTDTIPQIEHVIMLMMENHSFDNYLGTLGLGDGFRIRGRRPSAANRDTDGTLVRERFFPGGS